MRLFINFLNKFSKKKFFFFLCLGTLNSFIEVIGITLLIPMIDILFNNGLSPNVQKYLNFFNISSVNENYLLLLTIIILLVYFSKFLISIIIIFFNQVIIEDLRISIQKKVIQNYFKKSLISHNEDSIAIQIRMIAGVNSALYAINTFEYTY